MRLSTFYGLRRDQEQWRITSLSPIGRLEVIYDFKPYDNITLYIRTD
jgi:hypothetical protein